MIRSLYSKFVLITIGIMLISAVIAFLTVNTFYHQQLKASNAIKNMQIAEDIKNSIESSDGVILEELLQTVADVGYKIAIVDQQQATTFYGDAFRKDNLPEAAIQHVLQGEAYHGMRDFPKETFVTGFFSDETANTAGIPVHYKGESYALFIRPNIKMLFTEVHYLLGGMFIVMGAVSLIGMIFLARQLTKPIIKLTAATKQIGHEDFQVALPTMRNDEIGQLAKSFHTMTEQLAASDSLRKQFINDLTHDFQTPLQNIQGYAALLHEEDISEPDRIAYTAIIQSETKRLSALTKQLLLLTSLDALTESAVKRPVNITKQINETVENYRWQLAEKNISILTDIEDSWMTGDPAALEKLWDNLTSNAIKYSLPDGMIDISLHSNKDILTFTIKDNGIGIAASDIPHVFDRFYRADTSRQTEVSGTGLGLAIVEQIVRLHNGRMEVNSTPKEGTTFSVILPKGKHL